ncbi:MAG: YegS/Rv2252/BmrU family lipid kinase [Ruminococcaceae bacterium]|nr:YegS/Rv2252/BmrU family lipid kinase [Oscillospiraceae bacterium]
MKKMLFVMNSYSGMRRANRYLTDIIALFNRADYEVTVHMTGGQGDAARVVESRAKDMDIVVCCGGDGTFNETISGLLRAGADVPVGYIPAGSTNDFASSLKLSGDIMQAAADIVEGEPVSYDVGKFGDRYFSYVASFGAFTKASYATPQNVKNAIGHMAYLLGGISELSQIKNEHVRMEIDGQVIEDDFLFGAISNSTSLAGIVSLNPELVDMADGEFEVILVRAPRNLTEITECIQAVQAQKYSCAMITFQRARHVRIYADPQMPWTLDGEREEGHECVDAVNLHHAIRLVQRVNRDA